MAVKNSLKFMRLILEFEEFKTKESETRTKPLTEDDLLRIINENCKNFSFNNDLLWRGTNRSFGDFGIWFESDRKGTIGDYSYKKFFDDRRGYPVPRYKSLIGSTEKVGASYFSSESIPHHPGDDGGAKTYMVIPFDNSQIVFAGSPDLALWSNHNQSFSDDMFIMKEYVKDFKVPTDELYDIMSKTSISDMKQTFIKRNLGFEFFTTSTSLLIHESKVDWLKSQIS
jgi:hypothetical protein